MSSNKKRFFNRRPKNFHNSQSSHKPHRAPSKEYQYKNQLVETDVGITEYLTDGEGFSGVIKARYSDFQVNEIDLQGNLAKLTDTNCPEGFTSSSTFNYKETEKSPCAFISQEKWEALKILADTDNNEPVHIDADDFDKSARKNIHDTVRSYFDGALVANTVVYDKKVIEFKKFTKRGQDDRMRWPDDKGKYVHFLVYKEDMDTMEAISRIARGLRMKNGNFTYAGVKDKRSKSTQWVCVKKVFPEKLLAVAANFQNVNIGNLSFRANPLKLGQLQGNKFRIALRNVSVDEDVINSSMEAVRKVGFINYYGLQRFGNDKEVTTFDVGIKLLLGNWKEAVDLILKPKQQDDYKMDISRAKRLYAETRDAKKALAILKKKKSIEELLLEGLAKGNGNDYVNALENIPRNMRLLYLHSVQSLIWNKMVSKRIKLFGLKPLAGDLVIEDPGERNDNPETKENSEDSDLDDDCDNRTEKTEGTLKNNSAEEKEEIRCRAKVKVLTESDLNNYTIYDVVLPLPGYDVTYPENMKEYYKEALEERGLSLEMPKQKVRTYTLSGDYRNILVKIQDLSWKVMLYNSPTDNLILSDLEELNGQQAPQSIEGGQYKALILEFSLPPSCYATMVLREILKTNTSSSTQARLNDYHMDKEKKIIIENDTEMSEDTVENIETVQASSLLNPDKLEAFKNSIFDDLGGTKRKNEEEESNNKIQKVDESGS